MPDPTYYHHRTAIITVKIEDMQSKKSDISEKSQISYIQSGIV